MPDHKATAARLQSIDYKWIIETGEPFEDPNFLAESDSILDKTMEHTGVEKWDKFVWKRPSEVYGENKFTLYDTIDSNDI